MTEESFERGGALVFMIIDLLFHLVYLQCWEFIKPLLKFKQNYNKVSPHTRQNGHHQTIHKKQVLEREWVKGNPPTLLECKLI